MRLREGIVKDELRVEAKGCLHAGLEETIGGDAVKRAAQANDQRQEPQDFVARLVR
jgi:hypothetical protein